MAYKQPDDYIEVKNRIIEFREKYPEGRLAIKEIRVVNAPASFLPGKTLRNGNTTPDQIVPPQSYVLVVAQAFRSPDDTAPGEGSAWEPIPGRTPYTRDSELQNAETSAWGRALIALGAADATKGIASANEVRSRQYTQAWEDAAPAEQPAMPARASGGAARVKRAAEEVTAWTAPPGPAPAAPAAPGDPAPGPAPAPGPSGNGRIPPEQHLKWDETIGDCEIYEDDDEAKLKKKRDDLLTVRTAILGHVKKGVPPEEVAPHMESITRIGQEIKALLGG